MRSVSDMAGVLGKVCVLLILVMAAMGTSLNLMKPLWIISASPVTVCLVLNNIGKISLPKAGNSIKLPMAHRLKYQQKAQLLN